MVIERGYFIYTVLFSSFVVWAVWWSGNQEIKEKSIVGRYCLGPLWTTSDSDC